MNFFPELKFSLLSGVIPFVIYLTIFLITIYLFPRENRKRLYDRSNWTKKQIIYTIISKIITLLIIILILFSLLTQKIYLIIIGSIVFVIGAIIMVNAIITFCKTPLNKPVNKGIYKYSRNPQMVGIWTIFVSIGILTNSISLILLIALHILFANEFIKAEEESCIKKYGNEYMEYLKKIPRYF